MNVTLRQLKAFVLVAEYNSFTKAAEMLTLTQSALSGLIKELEQNLDIKLFDRTTRKMHLSDAGMTENSHHQGKILSAKVFSKGGQWFVSIAVELSDIIKSQSQTGKEMGIDLSITYLATLSDGKKLGHPNL